MRFDPILHKGYKTIQELEPDLKKLQEAINWCDHFVLIYPNWWGTMPALLKGLFDRMWLPGFAFKMRKTKQGTPALGWYKKLKGKTRARLRALGHASARDMALVRRLYQRDQDGDTLVLGFKVRVSHYGPSETAPEWKRNEWRRKIAHFGRLGR